MLNQSLGHGTVYILNWRASEAPNRIREARYLVANRRFAASIPPETRESHFIQVRWLGGTDNALRRTTFDINEWWIDVRLKLKGQIMMMRARDPGDNIKLAAFGERHSSAHSSSGLG